MLLDLLWNFHSPLPSCRAANLAFCWQVRLRPQQQFEKRVMATATPSGAGAGAGAGSAGHADLGVDTASGLGAAPSKPLFPDSGSVLVRNARVWVWDATGTAQDAMLDCAYHFEDWLWVRDGVVQVSASTQRWLGSRQHPHIAARPLEKVPCPTTRYGQPTRASAQWLTLPAESCCLGCTTRIAMCLAPVASQLCVMYLGRRPLPSCKPNSARSPRQTPARSGLWGGAGNRTNWAGAYGNLRTSVDYEVVSPALAARYPTAQDLDAAVSDRPVVLSRVCMHIGVVNAKALDLLGVTARYASSPRSMYNARCARYSSPCGDQQHT